MWKHDLTFLKNASVQDLNASPVFSFNSDIISWFLWDKTYSMQNIFKFEFYSQITDFWQGLVSPGETFYVW